MKLEPTRVDGAYVVVPESAQDERGSFARVFSASAFERAGLIATVAESSLSINHTRHTLRGLHYQDPPHAEAKLVRCIRGAVYDVVVDLRPKSTTYLAWHAVELREDNLLALYVPPGAAHGFLTLEDEATLLYQISRPHTPTASRGVRWNDPAFGIAWPAEPRVILERDARYPDFEPAGGGSDSLTPT
jgi:dTDP-4-dehydrorhamnose 3,5-epimerase